MKYKFVLVSVSALLAMAPMMVRADVITSDMLGKISQEAADQNNGCKLTESIAAGQDSPIYGQSVAPKPLWKVIPAQAGLQISIPWSPYWYIVGKQITWYDYDLSQNPTHQYWFGRYESSDACTLRRQYNVTIYAKQTIEKTFVPGYAAQDTTDGTIYEKFTVNGHPAALVSGTNSFCDQDSLAIQLTKNYQPYTVVFSHFCGDINAEMLRMAARVK